MVERVDKTPFVVKVGKVTGSAVVDEVDHLCGVLVTCALLLDGDIVNCRTDGLVALCRHGFENDGAALEVFVDDGDCETVSMCGRMRVVGLLRFVVLRQRNDTVVVFHFAELCADARGDLVDMEQCTTVKECLRACVVVDHGIVICTDHIVHLVDDVCHLFGVDAKLGLTRVVDLRRRLIHGNLELEHKACVARECQLVVFKFDLAVTVEVRTERLDDFRHLVDGPLAFVDEIIEVDIELIARQGLVEQNDRDFGNVVDIDRTVDDEILVKDRVVFDQIGVPPGLLKIEIFQGIRICTQLLQRKVTEEAEVVDRKVGNRVARHQRVGEHGNIFVFRHFGFTDDDVEAILNRLVACKDRVIDDFTRFLELPDTVLVTAGTASARVDFVLVAAKITFGQIVLECRILLGHSFGDTAGSRIGHNIGLARFAVTAGRGHTHRKQQKCRHTKTYMFCVFHKDSPIHQYFYVLIIQRF